VIRKVCGFCGGLVPMVHWEFCSPACKVAAQRTRRRGDTTPAAKQGSPPPLTPEQRAALDLFVVVEHVPQRPYRLGTSSTLDLCQGLARSTWSS